ncbi:hypothetical protein [Haloglycomyces albus]|uniref:hypothetical protein n=1 Tax=Haloglycomyces albus TaxID=526067 RepID=UPI00046D1A6E|nr:hypothetical protein [Haloglycomyces albus]
MSMGHDRHRLCVTGQSTAGFPPAVVDGADRALPAAPAFRCGTPDDSSTPASAVQGDLRRIPAKRAQPGKAM